MPENGFLASLPQNLRERLWAASALLSLPAGSAQSMDLQRPFLMIEGMSVATSNGRPLSIIVAGDFNLSPAFKPHDQELLLITDGFLTKHYSSMRYEYPFEVKIASFPPEAVAELMEDPVFLRALFERIVNQSMQAQMFQKYLYHDNAYEAVRYILLLARAYDWPQLTHQQIALISGRNRTTVTKEMCRLQSLEPELFSRSA